MSNLMSHCGTVSKDFNMNHCLECCVLLLMLIPLKYFLKWVSQKVLCICWIFKNLVLLNLIPLVFQSIERTKERWPSIFLVLIQMCVRCIKFILEDHKEVVFMIRTSPEASPMLWFEHWL